MAALDFPSSPTDGQVYNNYVWSASKGAWQANPVTSEVAVISPTAPSNPKAGDIWYNSDDGCTYVYYYDGDSYQWVASRNDATFSSTLGPRLTNLEMASPVVMASAAARNAAFPTPAQGNSVFRSDMGYVETYFALYNSSTNVGGATPAGWYPTTGKMPKIVATRNATDWSITGGQYNAISSNTYWTTTLTQGGAGNWSTGITIPFAGVWRVTFHLGAVAGGVTTASGWKINNTSTPGSWVDLYGVINTVSSGLSGTSVITRAFNANDVLSFFMYGQSTFTWVGTTGSVMPGQVVLEYVSPAQ